MPDEDSARKRFEGDPPFSVGSGSEPSRDPFRLPPPSDMHLRWSIVWLTAAPAVLAAIFITSGIVQQRTPEIVIGLAILAILTPLYWRRVRANVRELRSRRAGHAAAAPARPWVPQGDAALWYVGTVTIAVAGATLMGLILGLATWSSGGNVIFGLGILGVVPSIFCIYVLVTLLRRARTRHDSLDGP